MRTIMSCVLLSMLTMGNTVAESQEIFPLSGITVGMTSKELLEKYSKEDLLLAKRTDGDFLKNGVILYDISTNRFWDSLIVLVEDYQVKFLRYAYVNLDTALKPGDHDKAIKNIKPLFGQLTKQLGLEFEKKVQKGEANTRCAVYFWRREKDVVAFSHASVAQYKKGDDFYFTMIIAPTYEALNKTFKIATNSLSEDAALWADAMEDDKMKEVLQPINK